MRGEERTGAKSITGDDVFTLITTIKLLTHTDPHLLLPQHRKHNRIQVNPQLSQQTRNPALNYKVFNGHKT